MFRALQAEANSCFAATLAEVLPTTVQHPALAATHEPHEGFWWTSMGEQSAAAASFGLVLETPEGRFRPWSLVVFLPGSAEPLSCVQGLVELASATPIVARGASFGVELEPRAGWTWGQVTEDAQLVTRTDGIY